MSSRSKKTNSLIRYDQIRSEIERASTIDEVKHIRDRAEALRVYCKQAGEGLEMQNRCAEIKLRAERRAGEILSQLDKQHGARGKGINQHNRELVDYHRESPPTLKELGIDANKSSRWQLISSIPSDKFELRIEEIQTAGKELTTADFISHAKYLQREQDRERKRKAAAEAGSNVPLDEHLVLRQGDFREVLQDIADDSVDFIMTDLPYGIEHIRLYGDLGRFGKRVLKQGSVLACYCGQFHFPSVIRELESSLTYLWVAALTFTYPDTHFTPRIKGWWKPILLFSKGSYEPVDWISDVVEGARMNKESHPWQQNEEDVAHLIQGFTHPGDLVVDPCMGVGSTALAARRLSRRFWGAEIDSYCYNETLRRISEMGNEFQQEKNPT